MEQTITLLGRSELFWTSVGFSDKSSTLVWNHLAVMGRSPSSRQLLAVCCSTHDDASLSTDFFAHRGKVTIQWVELNFLSDSGSLVSHPLP